MTEIPADFDPALFEAVTRLARRQGRTTVEWLTAQVRRELRDARITSETIEGGVESNVGLVGRPDGTVSHLLEVLDGSVFTHHVRHGLADRDDLWVNLGLQPLISILLLGPVPLATGGELRLSSYGHDAVVGPAGWLPALEIGDVMGVRFDGGAVRLEAVDVTALPGPPADQAARKAIARHYRRARWWGGSEDLASRPAELTRAIGHAVLGATLRPVAVTNDHVTRRSPVLVLTAGSTLWSPSAAAELTSTIRYGSQTTPPSGLYDVVHSCT